MARRDDREYREYLREEQRSQPGCPAREVVLDQPMQATRLGAVASRSTRILLKLLAASVHRPSTFRVAKEDVGDATAAGPLGVA
jgi:hypothetical protein